MNSLCPVDERTAGAPGDRTADAAGRRHRKPLAGRLATLIDDRNAPAMGRLLLLASGLIVGLGTPLLAPTAGEWRTVGAVSAVMVAMLVVSARIDWRALPPAATLVHPALVAAALVALGLASDGRFAPLSGVLVLCFAYLGLTQRPGVSLLALVPAAVTFLIDWNDVGIPVLVRLAIALMVWGLLGELLARMRNQQDELTRALRAAANSDALTGVANRRDWDVRLAVAEPGDAVVLCDIDHFKAINDLRGHSAGDQVLADFGAVLRATLREGDHCARYGGEEFVLLLPATRIGDALTVLTRLHRRWARFRPGVTFSAGIALCHADRDNQATVAAADAALYRAKNEGRDTDRVERPGAAERSAPAA